MRTPLLHSTLLSLGLLTAPVVASAGNHGDTPKDGPHIVAVELAPGLHMLHGKGGFTGGNIGLSIGPDGIVMIDDSMPPFLDQLQEVIAGLTDQPIDYLINTHVHGDHIGNNAAFATDGVHIVAHDQLRQRMLDQNASGAENHATAALPVLTFSEEISFHLNGQTARVLHLPVAHTDGDAVIHFATGNVIHTGDIFFHGLFPFIDLDSGGTVAGYITAQEHILSLCDDETQIIPGHGPLATKADLARDLSVLKDCRNRVAELLAAGHSAEEIVTATPLADYHDDYNWGFITTERMTRTLIRDLGSR
jgi:glyoxylase-like metal-dependent hydrolase (beta-lactamase superfamily II)